MLWGVLATMTAASPLIVAHRGYSALAPENTLAAYRMAIEAGAPAAECDVYCTKDGQVVLLHDPTIDRTTDGTGPVTELTLEQVKALDAGAWKGEAFVGERIPTLAETLALTRGKLRLVIEVKQPGIAARVVETIREAEAMGDVTLISFSADTCRQLRDLEPTLPVGWLTGGCKENDPDEADTLIRTALAAHCQFLDVAWTGIRPALMERARLAGMAVWAWTIDDPAAMRQMEELGVAAVTTNDVRAGLGAFLAP
jgi:glycerophosphoryl diester phosphodiesterase